MSSAVEALDGEIITETNTWEIEMYLGDHALMMANTGRVPVVTSQSMEPDEEAGDTDEEIEEGEPEYDGDEEEDDDTDSEKASPEE